MQCQGCCKQPAHVEARKRTPSSPQGRVSTQFWRGDSTGYSQLTSARDRSKLSAHLELTNIIMGAGRPRRGQGWSALALSRAISTGSRSCTKFDWQHRQMALLWIAFADSDQESSMTAAGLLRSTGKQLRMQDVPHLEICDICSRSVLAVHTRNAVTVTPN